MVFIKILVVDDEYLIRNVIKEYCQSEGYKVDEASNGEEAIDKVYENEYDLIIMDIMMPDMDGYEASKEIKEINNRYNVASNINTLKPELSSQIIL